MADVSVQNERINGWIPSSATNVIMNWPERIKTQSHGPCGMTVNNDIDDDSATKHSDSHSQHGPASPWSLVEFQRLSGFSDLWRRAAFMCRFADMEQRHPTGMLTNIQGLRRSIYPGWPLFKKVNDNLQYEGPLPKACPCSLVHKDPINGTGGFFLSASSFSLSFSFWLRLFRDAWCSGHDTLRDGEQGLKLDSAATVFFVVCHGILAAAVHSLESGTVDESSFERESTQLLRMWIGSCLLQLLSHLSCPCAPLSPRHAR